MPGGDAQGQKPKHFQRHASCDKPAHASINVDSYYDVWKMYMFQKFKRPHMGINMEQHGDDYIRLNADLR